MRATSQSMDADVSDWTWLECYSLMVHQAECAIECHYAQIRDGITSTPRRRRTKFLKHIILAKHNLCPMVRNMSMRFGYDMSSSIGIWHLTIAIILIRSGNIQGKHSSCVDEPHIFQDASQGVLFHESPWEHVHLGGVILNEPWEHMFW